MQKRLDPKLDVVFKILFSAPEHRDLLCSLLTAVLAPASPIDSVKVLNPELPEELVTNEGAVLPLHVELADGRLVDLEMQAQPWPSARRRVLSYWARMHGAQPWPSILHDDLKACVAILILGYSELSSDRFHSTFEALEVHGGGRLSDRMQVHFVELPKLPACSGRQGKEALLEDWGRFFSARSDEELEALAMSNPVMARAKGALDFLSAQPDVQELARQRELAQLNYISAIHEAETRGKAEGKVEGKSEALLLTLDARGWSVSEEQRKRIVRCQDVAELDRWLRRAVSSSCVDEVLG